jgi:glycine/D-amino acid oxidase-like deaminating enzyme/nitrite reductase/ring-hydroxylating ferredoxin subunit
VTADETPRAFAEPGAPSLWQLTGPQPVGDDSLPERADVVIAGGGLAGLSTALELTRTGQRVVVVESHELGGRTTARTTGKVSLLQGSTASQVRSHAGDDGVAAYLEANAAGAAWIRDQFAAVPGAWEERTAYTYATTPEGEKSLRSEADAMAVGGRPVIVRGAQDAGAIGLPYAVSGALALHEQAQLHPLVAAAALVDRIRAAGGVLVDHCRMTGMHARGGGVDVETTRGSIVADRLIVATGSPVADRSMLFATLKPQRQAVVAFRMPEGQDAPEGMYLSVDPVGRSVRPSVDRDGAPVIVVAGGDLVTGRADRIGDLRDGILAWTREHFPGAIPLTWWAAQDYKMTNAVPFAGTVTGGKDRIYALTGFAKWGMTNAAAAAIAVTGELNGRPPQWHRRLHDRRPSVRDVVDTVSANASVGAHMVSGWAAPGSGSAESPERARVERHGIHPVAESTVDGVTCRVSAVCTHLGGIVRWNDAERSWDCPLHGSRFAPDGSVIEGPAAHDLASAADDEVHE